MALGCLLAAKAWRTAGWTAQKKNGSGLGVAFACTVGRCALMWLGDCAVGRSETLLQSFKGFKGFRGFRGLGAGKRQAWTPIRSH